MRTDKIVDLDSEFEDIFETSTPAAKERAPAGPTKSRAGRERRASWNCQLQLRDRSRVDGKVLSVVDDRVVVLCNMNLSHGEECFLTIQAFYQGSSLPIVGIAKVTGNTLSQGRYRLEFRFNRCTESGRRFLEEYANHWI